MKEDFEQPKREFTRGQQELLEKALQFQGQYMDGPEVGKTKELERKLRMQGKNPQQYFLRCKMTGSSPDGDTTQFDTEENDFENLLKETVL